MMENNEGETASAVWWGWLKKCLTLSCACIPIFIPRERRTKNLNVGLVEWLRDGVAVKSHVGNRLQGKWRIFTLKSAPHGDGMICQNNFHMVDRWNRLFILWCKFPCLTIARVTYVVLKFSDSHQRENFKIGCASDDPSRSLSRSIYARQYNSHIQIVANKVTQTMQRRSHQWGICLSLSFRKRP